MLLCSKKKKQQKTICQGSEGGRKRGLNKWSTEDFLEQWDYSVGYSNGGTQDVKHLSKPT